MKKIHVSFTVFTLLSLLILSCNQQKKTDPSAKQSVKSASAVKEKKTYETGESLVSILNAFPGSIQDFKAENPEKIKSVVINDEKKSPFNDGHFTGWGTSLCWWGNRVGYDDELSQQCASLFFSADDGIGFSIARYNIGGGDDPSHHHITRTDSAMPGWAVYNADDKTFEYNFDSDYNQRNVLKRIEELGNENLVVEVFSNSPPYFMTVSGCSSGGPLGSDSNLRPDQVDNFADYLATVTEHLEKSGIRVTSLEPMNEPGSVYWGAYSTKQEGCRFAVGEEQSTLILAVRKALDNHNLLHVKISASDETSTDDAYLSYNALDESAKKTVSRINTHTYNGKELERLRNLAADEQKDLWMSETDGNGVAGSSAGEMGAALWLAKKIIRDMAGLRPSAWVIWQAIDSHVSSEGYNGNVDGGAPDLNGGYWGLATANHNRKNIILTKKYYAFGQFSKYIRPQSVMLYTERDNVLAAYCEKENCLVIVALNEFANEQAYSFDISKYVSGDSYARAVRSSGSRRNGENLYLLQEGFAVKNGNLTVPLAPNSITTFIIPLP